MSIFTSVKGFETFCWEMMIQWWCGYFPAVLKIFPQRNKGVGCGISQNTLQGYHIHPNPFQESLGTCWTSGKFMPWSIIWISPWIVGKMGLEGWCSLLRGTSSGSCITRSSGLWEKTYFSPEAFIFCVCVTCTGWRGEKNDGRSSVGKTLGEKCREILTKHGECHEKCHGITHIWRGCKITPSDWKSLQSKLFVTLSGLLVASRKEKLCPVSLQLPREGTKRRNNGKKKKPQSELNFW